MPSLENIITPIAIKEQKQIGGITFPLVLSPNENAQNNATLTSPEATFDVIRKTRTKIEDQLLQHGAILFRGFPLSSAQDFHNFIEAFQWEALPYVGGAAPRTKITERVFTANEAPPDQPIPFHHEMAQVPTFPSKLFFYCNTAPPQGGQTPLVLSNAVYNTMMERHPKFVRELEDKQVTYTRVLPDGDDPSSPIGRGWQSTFQTTDQHEAERKCRQQGTAFHWLSDGCLRTTTAPLPAVREDSRTGKKMWFNSIIAAYKGWKDCRNDPERAVTFADGTPMSPEVMDDLEVTLNDLAVDVTWQVGDVFLVDNRQVLHARRPFTPPRQILASLIK